jgi:hypothetical protein
MSIRLLSPAEAAAIRDRGTQVRTPSIQVPAISPRVQLLDGAHELAATWIDATVRPPAYSSTDRLVLRLGVDLLWVGLKSSQPRSLRP